MSRTPAPDRRFLLRALTLAGRPRGATHPNPMVGALVVGPAGDVVGEGWHHRAGQAHAEVLALAAAGERARGGTLFVTLEPCNHQGRTPPCSRAVLSSGVARVVVGMPDPNPGVSGGGAAALRAAGVQVEFADEELAQVCRELNEDWIVWVTLGRPFVALKAAVTLDGYLAAASGDARWISGEVSRHEVQRLRSRFDAILVGPGTLLHDDPHLNARLRGARQPLRVALDPLLRCPSSANLLRSPGGPALLCCAPDAPPEREQALRAAGAEVVRLPRQPEDGRLDLTSLMTELARREIVGVLVEGGGELHRELLERRLADRAYIFVAPKLLGGRDGVPLAGRRPGAATIAEGWVLERPRWRRFGDDALVTGVPRREV